MGPTLYEIHFYGGPQDGVVALSPRPHDAYQMGDGAIYRADEEGEACLQWIADDRRRIDLHYRPKEHSLGGTDG